MARQDFRDYVTTVKAQFPGKMPKAGKVRKTFEIYTQDRLLLNYRGAIGVKTGWTTKARGTFVGAATRGGHTLVATVLHSELDSWRDSAALLSWGFAQRARWPSRSAPSTRCSQAGAEAARPAAAGRPAGARTRPPQCAGTPAAAACPGGWSRWSCWSAGRRAAAGPGAAAPPEPTAAGRRCRGLVPQSREPRRVRTPASPAPSAAPTTTPRTVQGPARRALAATGTGS